MNIKHQSPQMACILPAFIRSRLLNLAIKAEMAAQSSPCGRETNAYRAVIREIDEVRDRAREMRPNLFRAEAA